MSAREPPSYRFEQVHIDVARFATDDFNPFHDPHKWDRIRANPFGSPIVLGFQLEALLESLVARHRREQGEARLIEAEGLRFANYQLSFADVVRPGEALQVEVRRTANRIEKEGQLVNRVAIKKAGRLVLLGHQRDSRTPLASVKTDPSGLPPVEACPDRSYLEDGRYFLKRKFMSTGHAKNFLTGSLVDPFDHFDELAERVAFPGMFPAALISCALLEQLRGRGYDFEGNPAVYTGHQISIDRERLAGLRSNDRLHILVAREEGAPTGSGPERQVHRCLGMLDGGRMLFQARVETALLSAISAPAAGTTP